MQAMDAKPPYVMFEKRAVEDRAASEVSGHWIGRDVVYAIITPAGSKDKIEKVAEDWLRDLKIQVNQERFPANWLDAYKGMYEAFLRNEDVDIDGIPIKEWPVVTPATVKLLLSINILSVEQLAEANEETLGRIGMGARDLKNKATAFLETMNGVGKAAKKIGDLQSANAGLEAQVKELMDRLAKAEATINALEKSQDKVAA